MIHSNTITDNVLLGKRKVNPRVRHFILSRDDWQCLKCGSTEDLQVDHVVPYSWGGSSTVENLQTLCRGCNMNKFNNTAADYRTEKAIAVCDTYAPEKVELPRTRKWYLSSLGKCPDCGGVLRDWDTNECFFCLHEI